MPQHLLELLDLSFRWVHVIAGIMWIGNSLLFNWLDRNLRPSSSGATDVYGDIWLLHSGAFYFVEKTSLSGRPMPRPLHWFKWQAYTTWLSGAALLIALYYVGGRALLTDAAASSLSPLAAVGVGVGAIVAAQIVYDALWKVAGPRSMAVAGALSIAALVALAYGLTSLLSGRAAFLHMGAALATIMAANVAHVIMPSQRKLVASVTAGEPPDPAVAWAAKTRSIHNNYLTFPVIVLMLSNHFPGVYGSRYSWQLMLVLIAVGAAVRHILNVRFTFMRWRTALALTMAVGFAVLFAATRADHAFDVAANGVASAGIPDTVSFSDVRPIVDRRCVACHSRTPSIPDFGAPPVGVSFEEPARIQALADRIRARAVETRTMPLGNRTRMTDRERAMLARWIEQGARMP
jgi:uncharacterized membrane protein